jgi:biopolymer transport protein ExbB
MKVQARFIATFALLVPVVALAAGSWWSNDWKYRKEMSLDATAAGADITGTPLEVPVLIRLSLGNFSYFSDTKPDGSDFRLIAGDDKTPLKFHFEKYDVANQMALLWVRVPQITGGAKTDKLYAYYGNPDAPNAADIPGTYDVSQVLVLPFSETSGVPADLTAYKNNPSASTAQLTPASLIGGGAKFSGQESITVPATASLRLLPDQGLTASAWLRIDQAQQATVFQLADRAAQRPGAWPVASRGALCRRRQAHVVRRRPRRGQRPGHAAGDRRNIHDWIGVGKRVFVRRG